MASPAHRHRDRGLTLAAVAAMGLWLVAGCRERPPAEEEAVAVAEEEEVKPRIEVGVSGCSGLVQDPERGLLCLTRRTKTPKPLHLWLHGARDPNVELRFSGAAIEPKRTVDVDGVLLSVELPAQQGRLELWTDEGAWTLDLLSVSEDFEKLREEVQASWKAGDAAAALKRLDDAMGKLDSDESALLACSVGKVVLAAGDHDRVLAISKQVSDSSVVSCVGKASLLAAYVHIYLRPDFNAAELSLQTAEAIRGVDLETRIGASYLRGILEDRLGDVDESLSAFSQAARLAWLVGDDKQHASALVMQAVALARLGRFAEAETLARQVERRTQLLHPILAADIRSSVGWITVLRREDDPSIPDPSAVLRSAISDYAERDERRSLASTRLDLALTLFQNDELDAAAVELAALKLDELSPDLLVWFELTAARIALARGHPEAAEGHLERARLLADLNQDRELRWRVTTTRGELERARGRTALAIEAFRDASGIADELVLSVAGEAGRSPFATTHSRADVALAGLLLARGDTRDAMCVVVAARARHLRGLWARLRPPLPAAAERRRRDFLSRYYLRKQEISARLERSWELSTFELRELQEQLGAEGERADKLLAEATKLLEEGAPSWSCDRSLPRRSGDAVLTMMPSFDDDRWTAMLAWRGLDGDLTIDVASVHVGDPQAASAMMLNEFADALDQIANLRVIPVGAFIDVDFHELWLVQGNGDLTITYSVGLGEIEDFVPLESRAVVLAGSAGLASAQREVAAVTMKLGEHGWRVDSHWDPLADSQPSLFHYAGHGFDGGPLGWQNAIELPGVGRVSAAQIVAGQRAPEWVVLGACSVGGAKSDTIDGGMSLAAAFLLAGARLVIAPVRDVDDTVAYELGVGLYRDFSNDDASALPRALARLQREEFAAGVATPDAKSYNSWRAWTP